MPGKPFDAEATITELEGSDWGEARFGSALLRACHALRRKKLRDLTDEDLRVGIGQQVGLRYLVPLALERLQADPALQVTYFHGDLLANVLNIPAEFWESHPEWRARAGELAQQYLSGYAHEAVPAAQGPQQVRDAHARFTGELPPRRWLRAKGEIPEG